MIGGGEGSFIGAVHRIAANLDGQIELVCGCFSSRPEVDLCSCPIIESMPLTRR